MGNDGEKTIGGGAFLVENIVLEKVFTAEILPGNIRTLRGRLRIL